MRLRACVCVCVWKDVPYEKYIWRETLPVSWISHKLNIGYFPARDTDNNVAQWIIWPVRLNLLYDLSFLFFSLM